MTVSAIACGGPYASPTSPTVPPPITPVQALPTAPTERPFSVTLLHGTAATEVFANWRGLVTITPTRGIVNPLRPETVATSCGNGQPARSQAGFFGEAWFSCAYDTPGTYVASVTATTGAWTQDASTPVVVLPSTDVAKVLVPITMFSVERSSERWSFYVNAGAVLVPIGEYKWDFGDGTSAVTTAPTAQHVYQSSGVKVITVTATTRDGKWRGTARDEIIVK